MRTFVKISCTLLLALVFARDASAIVVSGTFPFPDEPTGDFAFGNAVQVGGASGIYIGDGWMLTASHIPPLDVTFGDTTYYYDDTNTFLLKNPDYPGLESPYADIRLFRLTEKPDLPAIKLSTQSPPRGSKICYVGFGAVESDNMSYWIDEGNYQWVESEDPTYYWGYKLEASDGMSWGYNITISDGTGPTPDTNIVTASGISSITLKTIFNFKQFDSQAVGGDSGAAVFYQDASEGWVLAGIVCCIETYPNPPTQAFVDSATHSVDLSFYLDEILSIMNPIPGDANRDGLVDGSDVAILSDHWQQVTDLGSTVGDFNEDGMVDGSDVTILADNWQYGVSAPPAGLPAAASIGNNGTVVPEPHVWIMLLGMILLGGWRFIRKP